MTVLKEFVCAAHGLFDEFVEQGETPPCPKGCSPKFVRREIHTAPNARGAATDRMDGIQRDLAHDFGLTDLKVKKDDPSSVMQNLRGSMDFSPKWVDSGTNLAPGWTQRGEAPASVNIASKFGMQGDNALSRVTAPKMRTQIVGSYKPDQMPSV